MKKSIESFMVRLREIGNLEELTAKEMDQIHENMATEEKALSDALQGKIATCFRDPTSRK